MNAAVRYELVEFDLHAHEYQVRMHIAAPIEPGAVLRLPAWIPGSYLIRDFARNIISIRASDGAAPVSLTKMDKQTWQLPSCDVGLVVDYRVYAFDLSVRGAYMDQTRAYFNGTCLFLSVSDRVDGPWELCLSRPDNPVAAEWRVATALPPRRVDEHGFGEYAAVGYDRLIDCPVEVGCFEHGAFAVEDRPHRFVVSDGGRFDMQRICRDVARLCAEHAAMFGELPVDGYLFHCLATADGYGGLEHRDSTSLICKRSDLPAPGLGKPDKGYRQFLGLCSHEYFHLWHVKRIRPAKLAAADLASEVHTELLWAFEGITSYYDELALTRSGVLAAEDYLDLFAATVTRVLRTPGRRRQSIAESSFDAWTKFYKQDENSPNAVVSYYSKGALVAFGLDVALRVRSGDTLSLDDLMRRLWVRYGQPCLENL
jgi:predicted metalloprotease with PDZ domain